MKKLLLLAVLLSGCVKKRMEQGEAEMQSAKIFGSRAYCSGDEYGWTCMEIESVQNGQMVYKPQPIVVCKSGECKKVLPAGEFQCTTMGVPK